LYSTIISKKNIFLAWKEFSQGKMMKEDVLHFAQSAEQNLLQIHNELYRRTYRHGRYQTFIVCDPKRRIINKASVRDRVVHQAVVRIIEPLFDTSFIYDSYASRKGKGAHEAGKRFRAFGWKLSQNNTKTVWVLQCDIKKFFDSVDHEVLLSFINKKIKDTDTLQLVRKILESFETKDGKGIPLGNLTSQLFANIYMNHFDYYVKRQLQVKQYIRYADDFVLLANDRAYLEAILEKITIFVSQELDVVLHPKKVTLRKWHDGVDFLGYIHFPYHAILRTKTKKRMLRNTQKSKQEYIKTKQWYEDLKSLMDDIDDRDKNKEVYQAVEKLDKITVLQLEKRVKEVLEKNGYINLSLEKPEIDRDVKIGLSVQDSIEGREEYTSIKTLKKALKSSPEDTNWRLMSEGVSYRLGVLSARLRGYENESDLLKLVQKKG
jgi:retron-type reverse transcriptase